MRRDDGRSGRLGVVTGVALGRQILGDLDQGAQREWLVTDGLGGYAMGTAAGLRTRRYHGLLVVATRPPGVRRLGLASLDPVLVSGDRRIRLATHEWTSGAVQPTGHVHLESFASPDGVPTWRWTLGPVALEAKLAMLWGRGALGVVYTLLRAPAALRLEVEALATWRDAHGERRAAGDPRIVTDPQGFVFEGAYRVRGPQFEPAGTWYRDAHWREEAARGLPADEDLWFAGRFSAVLEPGGSCGIEAWSGDLSAPPPAASAIVAAASDRAGVLARTAAAQAARAGYGPGSAGTDELLAVAADRFVVAGPDVVAGYPWFGDWWRDTLTSYEGLLLVTGRHDEGRRLLERAAATVSQGMLPNTSDTGTTEYNSADATLWFLHAVHRHVEVTGDLELAASLLDTLMAVVDAHLAGTRFGIRVDLDGLLTQGREGSALTWMDARIDGVPVTPRAGKAVEVNALWCNGLEAVADLAARTGRDATPLRRLRERAGRAFAARFRPGGRGGLLDVVDGPAGDDRSCRPNQLLAASLPFGPLAGDRDVIAAVGPLVTSLGLRSLDPAAPGYRPQHRGGPAARDAAYHQGTVWPWLIGPYVEARRRAGLPVAGLLDGLELHLDEWGLGSVSETADGDAPHRATGCPFQAWSVAELLRARALSAAE